MARAIYSSPSSASSRVIETRFRNTVGISIAVQAFCVDRDRERESFSETRRARDDDIVFVFFLQCVTRRGKRGGRSSDGEVRNVNEGATEPKEGGHEV